VFAVGIINVLFELIDDTVFTILVLNSGRFQAATSSSLMKEEIPKVLFNDFLVFVDE